MVQHGRAAAPGVGEALGRAPVQRQRWARGHQRLAPHRPRAAHQPASHRAAQTLAAGQLCQAARAQLHRQLAPSWAFAVTALADLRHAPAPPRSSHGRARTRASWAGAAWEGREGAGSRRTTRTPFQQPLLDCSTKWRLARSIAQPRGACQRSWVLSARGRRTPVAESGARSWRPRPHGSPPPLPPCLAPHRTWM